MVFKIKDLNFGAGPTIPARSKSDDNVVQMKTFEQLVKYDGELIEAITQWHERRRQYDQQVEQDRAAMDEELERLQYLMNTNKDQALQLLHCMFPTADPDEIDRVLWPAKDRTRLDVQVRKSEHTE